MRVIAFGLVVVSGSILVVSGCSSSSASTTGGATSSTPATTSKPAASSSAKATASSEPKTAKKAHKDPPKERPKTAKKEEIKKGDASEITKPIEKDDGKTNEKAIKAAEEAGGDAAPKKNASAPEGACKGMPDLAAKCSVNKLLFCKDGEEWEFDCDENARMTGHVGGACLETQDTVDCQNYDYDTSTPPEVYTSCSYDEEGNPYYCCDISSDGSSYCYSL